jgi:hypothetical protein
MKECPYQAQVKLLLALQPLMRSKGEEKYWSRGPGVVCTKPVEYFVKNDMKIFSFCLCSHLPLRSREGKKDGAAI